MQKFICVESYVKGEYTHGVNEINKHLESGWRVADIKMQPSYSHSIVMRAMIVLEKEDKSAVSDKVIYLSSGDSSDLAALNEQLGNGWTIQQMQAEEKGCLVWLTHK